MVGFEPTFSRVQGEWGSHVPLHPDILALLQGIDPCPEA